MQTLFSREDERGRYEVVWRSCEEAKGGGPGGYFFDVAYAGGGGYSQRCPYYEDGVRRVFDELRAHNR